VFEHFYTTKRVGQGTGLGLSICDAIVREHGGRIWAENRAQGGARFTIALPQARAEAAARAAASGAVADAPSEGPLDVSVLVVDDEPTLVELQREILESLGASVTGVSCGSEAVALLERRSFDLVVSDLKMPGSVSGQDLFHWVQSQKPPVARGFVFVTGDTAGDLNRDSLERAGARFLWKPFSVAEYVAALREASHETQPTA
jgi:two-component system NtrC family sensor kinase